jgi:hypothetical protein
MQSTVDITLETIDELLPQIVGRTCVVEAFSGIQADQAYVLRINGKRYRITRNDVRILLSRKLLPSNLGIPIIDYAIENDIFKAKQTDDDGEMVVWL